MFVQEYFSSLALSAHQERSGGILCHNTLLYFDVALGVLSMTVASPGNRQPSQNRSQKQWIVHLFFYPTETCSCFGAINWYHMTSDRVFGEFCVCREAALCLGAAQDLNHNQPRVRQIFIMNPIMNPLNSTSHFYCCSWVLPFLWLAYCLYRSNILRFLFWGQNWLNSVVKWNNSINMLPYW